MPQRRLLRNFGIGSAAIVLLILGSLLVSLSLKAADPSRTTILCVPAYSADALCYQNPQWLTKHKITAITVSSAGNVLAAGDRNTIRLWNLKTNQSLKPLQGHDRYVSAIALSPDEQVLASSSLDGTIKLWDLPNSRLVGTLQTERASNLVFSPDGRMLASSSRVRRWADGAISSVGVQVWDVASRRRLYGVGSDPIRSIAFSPDGQLIAIGDHTKAEVWKLQDGERLHVLNSGEVTGLIFGQDGQTLITGSSKIKLWDLRNGALLRTFDAGTSDLALSPDGQTLASSAGGAIQFWQLLTEQSIGAFYASAFSSVIIEFALQGQAIVSSGTDGIRVWRAVQQRS